MNVKISFHLKFYYKEKKQMGNNMYEKSGIHRYKVTNINAINNTYPNKNTNPR
jgi:hypothetical protein